MPNEGGSPLLLRQLRLRNHARIGILDMTIGFRV